MIEHRVIVELVQVAKVRRNAVYRRMLVPVYGTRVRCSCGWGGAKTDEKDRITHDRVPSEGGRAWADLRHAEHTNEELG